jgi:hypothetical protein
VQKNFTAIESASNGVTRPRRARSLAPHARTHASATRKSDKQKVPIPSAFLVQREIRHDVDAITRDLRARSRGRRDDRDATARSRAVTVHTSSTRFGFFRLLRY